MRSTDDNAVQNVKSITSAIGGLSISTTTSGGGNEVEVDEGPSAGGDGLNLNGVGDGSKSSNNKTKSRRSRKKNKNNNNNESHSHSDRNDDGDTPEASNNGGTFVYSGNNIVLMSNDDYEGPEDIPPSCVDNTDRGESRTTGGIANSEETSILGLALDMESEYDEDDSTQRAASWCLANQSYSDQVMATCPPISYSGAGGDHRYSYQAASAFHIGPVDSSYYTRNSNYKKVKSPDSESSTSYGSASAVPAFAYCTSFMEDMSNCQAQNCTALAQIKCAQCLGAYYCNEDHQKIDWSQHKEFCTAYRVEGVGIGAADGLPVSAAVASRNVPEGQVIFEEKAMLVFALADSISDNQLDHVLDLNCVISRTKNAISGVSCKANRPACLGCMRVVEFIGPPRYQCSKCRLPLCSYNCQFLVCHQAGECDAVSSQNTSGDDEISSSCYHTLYMDVEILRALQLEVYDHLQWDRLLEMKNNVRVDAYKNTDRFKLFAQNIVSLVPFSAKFSGYNLDLIMDVHAIISSLSFRPSMTSSFKLLFHKQSLFAHNCVPNTFHYIKDEHTGDQARMRLVTKAASAIIEGEIICIDFTPSPYLPYPRRKKILQDHLSISNCLCQRCQNPSKLGDFTGDIKCPSCRVGKVYPEIPSMWEESVWSCNRCQEEISYCKVEAVENDCEREISFIICSQSKKVTVSNLMGFINRRGKLDLNPGHCLILMAWCFVESYLRGRLKAVRKPDPTFVYTEETLSEFAILGEYVEVMEKHMDAIRPGIWIDRGIVLFHKFYSSFVYLSREYQDRKVNRKDFIQRCLKCLKVLQKALETLSVYEGYNSPLVSQLTQEVTSALTDLKRYVQFLLMQDSNENLPLPSFNQIGIGE